MVALGDAAPGAGGANGANGVNGAGAGGCGGRRLRICAEAGAAAHRASAATAKAAATLQRRTVLKPRRDIGFFVDPNRGNFKPPCVASSASNRGPPSRVSS